MRLSLACHAGVYGMCGRCYDAGLDAIVDRMRPQGGRLLALRQPAAPGKAQCGISRPLVGVADLASRQCLLSQVCCSVHTDVGYARRQSQGAQLR